MVNIQAPEWINEIDSVFIISPSARCGVTLLQRLLNSTRKIIVYGESTYMVDTLPRSVEMFIKMANSPGIMTEIANARKNFLENTEAWTSNLTCDMPTHLNLFFNHIYNMIQSYQRDAEGLGYRRWGIKQPITTIATYNVYRQLLPASKFIAIYRNLMDVARSYKSRTWLNTMDEVKNLAQTWVIMLQALEQALKDCERSLFIKYEDLVSNSETHIRNMESLTNLTGIDRSVMSRKINTFIIGEQYGGSSTGYIEPTELTEEETDCLLSIGGDLMERLGYTV